MWVRINWLASLPVEIGRLTNLAELKLERNPLGALPPEIRQLPNVQITR